MNSCVNMQILFMHSLQELHHETLHTLGTTFICSVLDLRRKERKELSCSSFALGYVCLAGFQEPWYTFASRTRVFLRRALAEKKNSSTFSMEKGLTYLWAINTPRFVLPKEGFYSQVCAFSEFIFFSGRNRFDNWLSFRLSLFVYCMHTFGYLSPKLFDHKNLFALSPFYSRNNLK